MRKQARNKVNMSKSETFLKGNYGTLSADKEVCLHTHRSLRISEKVFITTACNEQKNNKK